MQQILDFLSKDILSSLTILDLIVRVSSAMLIGGIIGFEREKHNRPAGLRTHILVCMGACTIALAECMIASRLHSAELSSSGVSIAIGRIAAQVVSGVGFLGAGTIVLSKRKISGLTTAASLWNVACLGIAIGYGFYILAYISCVLILIVLSVLSRVIRVNAEKRMEVKFVHRVETMDFINTYFENKSVQVLDIDFHVEITQDKNLYTNVYLLKLPSKTSYTDIVAHLSEYKNIQSVRTTNL